jgi:hypothetical protein
MAVPREGGADDGVGTPATLIWESVMRHFTPAYPDATA